MKKFFSRLISFLSIVIIAAFAAYTAFWFYVAGQLNNTATDIWTHQDKYSIKIVGEQPRAQGFPAPPKLIFNGSVTDKNGNTYSSPSFALQGFPIQTQALRITADQGLNFSGPVFKKEVNLDSFDLQVRIPYGFPSRINRQSLQVWQKAGGTIPVERLDITRSTLHLAGDGYVTVDESLQPAGALSAELTGLDDLIVELVQDGTIGKQQAMLAQAFVNLLSQQNNKDGKQALVSGVRIENGNVFFGPIKVATLPQWTWEE